MLLHGSSCPVFLCHDIIARGLCVLYELHDISAFRCGRVQGEDNLLAQ